MPPLPPTPSVREMGRMALPLGSRLVAGSLGLERPVRWARVSGVLSPLFPVLNSDDVALLDLPLVQSSNPSLSLARIVREFGRLGLAAIVVKGEADAAAQREAERSNLPLFVLPDGADVNRVARAIVRLISDREAQEEAQAAALYRQLSQGVAEGEGLEGLVRTLHALSGHSVRVSDLQSNVMAQAGIPPLNSIDWTRPLFVADTPIAILTLRDAREALDDFSRLALEQGAAALALELVKIEAVEAAREGVQADLVATLLLGEDEALIQARARAADYPLDVVQWVVIAVADAHSLNEEMMRSWARRGIARAEALKWQARVHLSQENFSSLAHQPQSERMHWQVTFVLAGGAASWEASRVAFSSHLAEVWNASVPLSLAAGEPGRGLEGLRRALEQARDALFLGLRLFGEGRSYLHREMGLYRLLRHLQGTDDLHHFLDRTLAALLAYDEEHETELVATLRVLLEQGRNISATAKAMHLHRNSLVYRLDRIREISGLDPTEPEDAFTLRLALMLAPLRFW